MLTFIRSTLFNFAFYGITAIACVLCIPCLLLPKKQALYLAYSFVHSVYFLEKYILGLDFEVEGLENLPREGAYLVAAKHQSAYETMKLHILFKDPAIVLKKELLSIPLWGQFLAKTEPIAIDRSKGINALTQIIAGAKQVKEQGRPIIIFPQGTRVYTWQTPEDKSYKIGIARIYEETDMPIIPLALNSGMFWSRKSWIKRGGKVTFKFLKPIEPGKGIYEVMKELETQLETHSNRLCEEAQEKYNLPVAVKT